MLALSAPAKGQELLPSGGVRPTGQANALDTVPVVDGDVLNDPAWEGAIAITGFTQTQPRAGQPVSQETEVFVGFTDDALYIGVVAYDDDPSAIIATDSRRDSSLDDTDSFRVMIDGLLDRQNGYIFGTNPAGVEYDGQVTREGAGQFIPGGDGGFNLNWDAPWTVRAQISDIGWSAEMRIPFTSLRYGTGDVQSWGFNFERAIRRNNEIAYWSPMSQDRDLLRVSEAGTVEGIRAPRQLNLQVTPYVLAKYKEGGELAGSENDQEFGFDLKYSITPSLTLDLTYNTDFAQVEVDEQQVNLDRFNLFYPEKRPFFLENAGLFEVGNAESAQIFFSRRIGIADDGSIIPVDGGLRLSGKIGAATNIGFLHMQTEAVEDVAPKDRFTVARISQELPNRSSIGMIFTDRQGDGSYLVPEAEDENQAYAIDGRWGIGDHVALSGWFAKTDTPGLKDKDEAYSLQGEYSSALWDARLSYTEVEENFNPEVGFLARTNYRFAQAFLQRRVRNESWKRVLELRPHINSREYWKPGGFTESRVHHFHVPVVYRSGAEVGAVVNLTKEGVTDPFEIVDGVTVPAGTYDHTDIVLAGQSDKSQPLSYGIQAIFGGRFGGDRVALGPWVEYRVGEVFRSTLSFDYNDFDLPYENGDFTANLARLRLSYSFSPKIQIQALIQYNEQADTIGTNLRFSWLQTANSGLFIVYNEVDERFVGAPPTGREFIVKYSYIFDVFN